MTSFSTSLSTQPATVMGRSKSDASHTVYPPQKLCKSLIGDDIGNSALATT